MIKRLKPPRANKIIAGKSSSSTAIDQPYTERECAVKIVYSITVTQNNNIINPNKELILIEFSSFFDWVILASHSYRWWCDLKKTKRLCDFDAKNLFLLPNIRKNHLKREIVRLIYWIFQNISTADPSHNYWYKSIRFQSIFSQRSRDAGVAQTHKMKRQGIQWDYQSSDYLWLQWIEIGRIHSIWTVVKFKNRCFSTKSPYLNVNWKKRDIFMVKIIEKCVACLIVLMDTSGFWFGSFLNIGFRNVCHCLLFLEKLCDAQFSDVFHELSRASLNFCRKWSRASSSE